MNAPVAPAKRKSRAGKILLIVGIVFVVFMAGIGPAIYFGVKAYLKSTKSSAPYALAESTLRRSARVKEKMGEIKNIGVPLGTYKEEDDGSGFAIYSMSVEGESASGQYTASLIRRRNTWRVETAQVQLSSGAVVTLEMGPPTENTTGPEDNDGSSEQNQNANTADSNTAGPKPKIISGGVINGKAISLPQPAYPRLARSARASGTVTVDVVVDEQGKVVSASAVSGHPLLHASAVAAARQATFSPTRLSGKPVQVSGKLIYTFVAEP